MFEIQGEINTIIKARAPQYLHKNIKLETLLQYNFDNQQKVDNAYKCAFEIYYSSVNQIQDNWNLFVDLRTLLVYDPGA